MRLQGQRALVTGGSRSIGQAIALGIAREGADVVVNYRQDRAAAERTAAAIRALGRRAALVQGDTSVRADVDRLVAEAIEVLGAIDDAVAGGTRRDRPGPSGCRSRSPTPSSSAATRPGRRP